MNRDERLLTALFLPAVCGAGLMLGLFAARFFAAMVL